jgi:hypothetical protein
MTIAAALLIACRGNYKQNFANLKKSVRILKVSEFWHFLRFCKIPLLSTSTSTGHAKRFDSFCFSVCCCVDLCESALAGKVAALCMACKCSLSLWRVVQGSKLMHLELIHGLFIT